jgi:hypothetical protein
MDFAQLSRVLASRNPTIFVVGTGYVRATRTKTRCTTQTPAAGSTRPGTAANHPSNQPRKASTRHRSDGCSCTETAHAGTGRARGSNGSAGNNCGGNAHFRGDGYAHGAGGRPPWWSQ